MDGEVDKDSRILRAISALIPAWYEEVRESYGNDQ
jgi:hypothetical protein